MGDPQKLPGKTLKKAVGIYSLMYSKPILYPQSFLLLPRHLVFYHVSLFLFRFRSDKMEGQT